MTPQGDHWERPRVCGGNQPQFSFRAGSNLPTTTRPTSYYRDFEPTNDYDSSDYSTYSPSVYCPTYSRDLSRGDASTNFARISSSSIPSSSTSASRVFKPKMEVRFDGSANKVGFFLVETKRFFNRWGYQFQSQEDAIEFVAVRSAAVWYVDLYHLNAPELHSINLFFGALCARFGDPHLKENVHTGFKQFKQGSMMVREYSVAFRTLVAKLPEWLESLLMDYYREGLNLEIMGKAIEHANPQFLVGWIQADSEVEAQICLVRSLRQARAPVATSTPVKAPTVQVAHRPTTPAKPDASKKQRFKMGHCLMCGGQGYVAA